MLAPVLLAGCAGMPSSRLTDDVNNVYLAPVKNRSSEIGLANILSEDVTQQFLADGRLDLVDRRDALVIVQGAIVNYNRYPTIYNQQDVVQQFRVRVEMNIVLKDARTGETLNEFDNLYRQTTYSDVNPPLQSELGAKREVLRKLARDVVNTVVERWPYLKL